MTKLTDKFKKTYFRVQSWAESETVQKMLFSLGYMWSGKSAGVQRKVLPYPSNGYIYVDGDCRLTFTHSTRRTVGAHAEFVKATVADLTEVAAQWKREKTKKRKESRKRAKLRKQGWIPLTGGAEPAEEVAYVLFNNGKQCLGGEWQYGNPRNHGSRDFDIIAYMPKKAEEKVISLDEMVTAVAADMGKEVAKIPVTDKQSDVPVEAATVGDVDSSERGSGARFNAGKPDYSLIPMTLLEGEARVWAYGARKYKAWNWMKGMDWSVPFACAMRHMAAWQRGEDTDPETGESHLDHAMCNLRMLRYYKDFYKEGDDRPKQFFTQAG